MNKNAIKKFAIEARQKLIASVTDKAGMLGITAEGVSAPTTKGNDFEVYQTVAGTEVTLNKKQCEQRRRLVEQIETKGFEEVVEEVAYTWFNRICAIRFMEVNDYLPSRVRALSSEKKGKNEPDLVTQAPDVELDLTDVEKEFVIESKMSGKLDELFAMLFVKQCNKLHEVLPELFEETSDYTELLLNISFTDKESIVQMLVNSETGIPEDDFNVQKSGQVEIIGWLYQYYNEERKNEVINIYKGTVKKEDIPAATQLFTTDWVVRYMVDNSLGRYWIERNPDSKLREKLEFFVMPKNGRIEYIDEKIDPTEITFLDPCMGSGHILVYAFDVLMEIYRECGYSDRDAALNIVQNNLFGLDIDDRAYQLAYFAVMMKARSYNRRALTQGIINNLCAIQESNDVEKFLCDGLTQDSNMNKIGEYLVRTFKDAKEIGSLQSVDENDYKLFSEYLLNVELDGQLDFIKSNWIQKTQPKCLLLAKQANILAKKYNVVATNPPYLGKMQGQLKKFVVDNYKDYATDLFAVFMNRNFMFCKRNGYSAFMTPYVWMFIRAYDKLREFIVKCKRISSLVQMEYSAYEEATVPICSFVLKNSGPDGCGTYIKLSSFKGGMKVQEQKVKEAIQSTECDYMYVFEQNSFNDIPGMPIAYWIDKNAIDSYRNGIRLGDMAQPKTGMTTGDNNRFLRLWHEIDVGKMLKNAMDSQEAIKSRKKWFPYCKGGGFRRWYGYNEYVVNWENNGFEIKNNVKENGTKVASVRSENMYFKPLITWSAVTSGKFSCRNCEGGALFDSGGSSIEVHNHSLYLLALLNSCVGQYFLDITNATINYQPGDVASIPVILKDVNTVESIAKECLDISKQDWDLYETSWDFEKHPILKLKEKETETNGIYLLENLVCELITEYKSRFVLLKNKEEELNRLFIDIYGLNEVLIPDIEDKYISLFDNNVMDIIKSLISYAIGCMFGRYSIDTNGLLCTETKYNMLNYQTFIPDEDNVIPITDAEYFSDDIVGMFCQWVRAVFGDNTLEKNLDYISRVLGNKGDSSREILRNYFLKDFFSDHLKMYQNKPIYWMFDSGKEDGFKALIYMHRYTPDTVGIIRTDYLHKTQKAIEQAMQRAEYTSENSSSASDKKKAVQQITKYTKQLAQMKSYDEAMAHIANQRIEIDLDDGVKVNYEKFQGVEVAQEGKKALKIDLLAKIK